MVTPALTSIGASTSRSDRQQSMRRWAAAPSAIPAAITPRHVRDLSDPTQPCAYWAEWGPYQRQKKDMTRVNSARNRGVALKIFSEPVSREAKP